MVNESLLWKVITDLLVLSAVSLPLLILRIFGVPSARGFFCSDESIRYPFKGSTVPTVALHAVGFGLPIILMAITELVLAGMTEETIVSSFIFGVRIPHGVVRCYETVVVFIFGAACSQLITDVGKYTVGRLRPHFLDVCQPDVECSLVSNHDYISNYTCQGSSSSGKLKEARLSFPSSHSSFAAYTMLYLIFYIQERVEWNGSGLLKHAVQLCCFLACWSTALSRINDNKHHWSDVTVGLMIGTIVAILTTIFISRKRETLPVREEEP